MKKAIIKLIEKFFIPHRYAPFRRHFAGLAMQLLVYANIHRNRNLRTKFIIFGLGRTGSALLVRLLDQNPEIQCDGEMIRFPVLSPSILLTGSRDFFEGTGKGSSEWP
ncbi:MAG: hypothetical protein ACE5JK_05440 [Candidatus Omnitrophota bacterium]